MWSSAGLFSAGYTWLLDLPVLTPSLLNLVLYYKLWLWASYWHLNTMLRINQLKALCPSTKSSCVHLLCINRSGEKRKQTHYLCVSHQSNSQLVSYWVVRVTFSKRNWHKNTEWDERNPEPWINGNVAWCISGIKKE